ncbi:MAG: hypothetical protein IJB70_08625 [Clostridia bacterium]|nr:hypothetical protein [Clostridia bacterium]
MVEYFVTKGKLVVRNNESLVVADGEAKALSQPEFILWTSLYGNILTKGSLEEEFNRRMKKYGLYGDVSFEQTLARLETRQLIASKSDYPAADAPYNLVKELYVVPLGTVSVLKRALTFILMFIKGASIEECIKVTDRFKVSDLEKRIIKFSKKIKVSVAEIIRINDKNLWNIKSEEYMKSFIFEGTLEDPKIVTFSNPGPGISEIEGQDFRKSKNKTFENQNSRLVKSESADF